MVSPRQALLCHVQLVRAAITYHPGVSLLLAAVLPGMSLPFRSVIPAASGALWALSNSSHFSNFIFSVSSCLSGLWGGETTLLQLWEVREIRTHGHSGLK